MADSAASEGAENEREPQLRQEEDRSSSGADTKVVATLEPGTETLPSREVEKDAEAMIPTAVEVRALVFAGEETEGVW